jgi:hypothetical protein
VQEPGLTKAYVAAVFIVPFLLILLPLIASPPTTPFGK